VTGLGLHTIMPMPILHGVWHAQGGSGGIVFLRIRFAIVLQSCEQCRWKGGIKGGLTSARKLWSERMSCEVTP